MDLACDLLGDLVTDGSATFDRGLAIFRSGPGVRVGAFRLVDLVVAEVFERFRLPNEEPSLAGFFGVLILVTLVTAAVFTTVFVLRRLSLTFVGDVTTVALTILPFLSCALTCLFDTLVIRPLTARFTFGTIPVLPFLGETSRGFEGGSIAFRFPINPRHFSAPHLHFCSFAPSNQEKL